MPEYLSPGVYIEEVNTGPRPIEGVGTALAAFVGFAPGGPVNRPVLITNWTQYVTTFGTIGEGGTQNPYMPGTYMAHAVRGYFSNGGGRCYVTRVVAPSSTNGAQPKLSSVQAFSRSSKAIPSLTFTPRSSPASDIQIDITQPTVEGQPDGTFSVKIRMADVEESFDNLNMGKKGAKNVTDTINQASKLVMVEEATTTGAVADRAPEFGVYTIKAEVPQELPKLKSDDFVGSVVERSGVDGLEITEDVTMICCPDLMAAYEQGAIDKDGVRGVQLAMIAHCERMGGRMAILDPLPNLSPQEMLNWRATTNYDSMFAAMYYPWIDIMGPGPDGKTKRISVPPSGHMAGIYARSDNTRGVHKAPANEVITTALGPTLELTKGEQELLNPKGVNCIRSFTGRGVRVWGARTLSSDPAWRYINVRRLFNYVEKSLEIGTQWIVFEPNDPNLWARVRRDIGAFLTGVWRDGMLFGLSPQEAFYVKCDAELNPPDVRDRGQLVIEVGMAPVKPAEFVIFRFSQFSGGGA